MWIQFLVLNLEQIHIRCGSRAGGVQGPGSSFLAHDVGFLTLGPKLDPFFVFRPKLPSCRRWNDGLLV